MVVDLFPSRMRAMGVGAPYNLATAIFGGTAPFLLTWLAGQGRADSYFVYLAVLVLLSGVGLGITSRRDAGASKGGHAGGGLLALPTIPAPHDMNRDQWSPGSTGRGGPMFPNRQRLSKRFLARLIGACMAATGVVALPAAPAVAAEPGTAPNTAPAWFDYERPATYEPVKTRINVPVRDGTQLGCELSRPGRDGKVAPGRFPVVIWEFTPYTVTHQSATEDLLSGVEDLLPGTESTLTSFPAWILRMASHPAEYLASRGYAVAVCDVRGTGTSGGDFTTWFPAIEARDNYDLVEWLARQPWSNGRVGQGGSSYASLTSQRVAALNPPHLEAIVPQIAPGNIYEWVYPGGIPSTGGTTWAAMVAALSFGRANPVQVAKSFADHPLYDDYWRQIDITDDLDDIRVPTLMMGGWQDLFTNGTVESFTGRSSSTWLVMGPGQHTPPHFEPHAPVPLGAQLAWWDHWLMQLPHAPLPSARVTSIQGPVSGGGGEWKEFSQWPPSGFRSQRMYLSGDRSLSADSGATGVTSYVVNPLDGPARSWFGDFAANYPEDPAADQSIADRQRLTFTTGPLADDSELAGAARVHLRAALSAPDGRFVVKVEDVAPDGKVVAVTDGYLLASHRDGDDHEVAVTPGRFDDYEVSIRPTHWRFAQGHRLRIAVTSGDVPLLLPDASTGSTVSIAHGAGGSWVDLPLR
jgi:predicted acyl esterase